MINITLNNTTNNLFYSYLKGWERALLAYEEEFGSIKVQKSKEKNSSQN
jgi:hypothetical protein